MKKNKIDVKARYKINKRMFRKPIFFGAGKNSERELEMLREQFEYMLAMRGGTQQPLPCTATKEAWEADRKVQKTAEKEVREMLFDIIVAMDCDDILRKKYRKKARVC